MSPIAQPAAAGTQQKRSQLDQLKKFTKVVADTGDLKLKELPRRTPTTNPSRFEGGAECGLQTPVEQVDRRGEIKNPARPGSCCEADSGQTCSWRAGRRF